MEQVASTSEITYDQKDVAIILGALFLLELAGGIAIKWFDNDDMSLIHILLNSMKHSRDNILNISVSAYILFVTAVPAALTIYSIIMMTDDNPDWARISAGLIAACILTLMGVSSYIIKSKRSIRMSNYKLPYTNIKPDYINITNENEIKNETKSGEKNNILTNSMPYQYR